MNKQSFDISTQEGLKRFKKFFNTLIELNQEDMQYFNDMHIRQEESYAIIEWENVPYNHEWGGKWVWLEEDDVLMREVHFPDGHYDYVFPEEVDEKLKEWHEQHPEWVLSDWGTWTNMDENRPFMIDMNIEKWVERKEEPNDSTYSECIFKKGNETTLMDVLACVDSDVLRRTDFIVFADKDLASRVYNTPELELTGKFAPNKRRDKTEKVGKFEFPIECYPVWDKEPEKVDLKIHAYYNKDASNQIMFVTDNGYLIYKVILEEQN